MARFALALALLLGGLVSAQPNTYFVPIAARTPTTSPVGPTGLKTTLWLPDPGVGADQALLFGSDTTTTVSFRLDTQALATVSTFPATATAVATAPGVNVGGSSRTLVALAAGGAVTFGTIDSGTWVSRGPSIGIVASDGRMALSATPGGGAALLTTEGFNITRYDLDASSGQVVVTPGLTIPAAPNGSLDEANALLFDGRTNLGFVGGRNLGDLYTFNANLDAGRPSLFDPGIAVGTGRLGPPISGLAAYVGQQAHYLLVANLVGITVYDLTLSNPLPSAFRVVPQDGLGPILPASGGVAVTNLPAGTALPEGVIAVGDVTQRGLALVRWDTLANLDGGLLFIDTTFDPRGDGGFPDGGLPDGGTDGGGGGRPGPPSNIPIGPPVPVDHGSSCSTAAGGPALLAALAGLLLLLPRRRQRR